MKTSGPPSDVLPGAPFHLLSFCDQESSRVSVSDVNKMLLDFGAESDWYICFTAYTECLRKYANETSFHVKFFVFGEFHFFFFLGGVGGMTESL